MSNQIENRKSVKRKLNDLNDVNQLTNQITSQSSNQAGKKQQRRKNNNVRFVQKHQLDYDETKQENNVNQIKKIKCQSSKNNSISSFDSISVDPNESHNLIGNQIDNQINDQINQNLQNSDQNLKQTAQNAVQNQNIVHFNQTYKSNQTSYLILDQTKNFETKSSNQNLVMPNKKLETQSFQGDIFTHSQIAIKNRPIDNQKQTVDCSNTGNHKSLLNDNSNWNSDFGFNVCSNLSSDLSLNISSNTGSNLNSNWSSNVKSNINSSTNFNKNLRSNSISSSNLFSTIIALNSSNSIDLNRKHQRTDQETEIKSFESSKIVNQNLNDNKKRPKVNATSILDNTISDKSYDNSKRSKITEVVNINKFNKTTDSSITKDVPKIQSAQKNSQNSLQNNVLNASSNEQTNRNSIQSTRQSKLTTGRLHSKLEQVQATLCNELLWNEFNALSTEMIVTKSGR